MGSRWVQDFEIPHGLEPARRHVERYFAQFSSGATRRPDGSYRVETAVRFAQEVVVTVNLTPYSDARTWATVSAETVQGYDWGSTKRLVRKLSKILAEPEWNWPLAGF
jgi:hypothetical protein